MHLITPYKCMLTLALHLPCNWRPQNGTMNKAERAERTPPVLPLGPGWHPGGHQGTPWAFFLPLVYFWHSPWRAMRAGVGRGGQGVIGGRGFHLCQRRWREPPNAVVL